MFIVQPSLGDQECVDFDVIQYTMSLNQSNKQYKSKNHNKTTPVPYFLQ